jgi:hypothetical protein
MLTVSLIAYNLNRTEGLLPEAVQSTPQGRKQAALFPTPGRQNVRRDG